MENLLETVSDCLLRVEGLETSFQLGKNAASIVRPVNGISYEIRAGETLGIVGESGCGKSVTSLSIMGLIDQPGRISAGKIIFKGKDLVGLSEEKMEGVRGNEIAMIFQEPMTALNPVLTIGDQIDEQVLRHKKAKNKKGARLRTLEMLALVGIPSPQERADAYPHELSGGMRQRAMIAMALSCEPDLLIADEPTTALDVTIQAQILELIQSLQDRLKMSVQFITHDLGVISELADRVMVMYAGRVCETGPTEVVLARPSHPYTVALMESLPRLGGKGRHERLKTIPGSVPPLSELPAGCPFQNRCVRVLAVCRKEFPALLPVAGTAAGIEHKVACFNPSVS